MTAYSSELLDAARKTARWHLPALAPSGAFTDSVLTTYLDIMSKRGPSITIDGALDAALLLSVEGVAAIALENWFGPRLTTFERSIFRILIYNEANRFVHTRDLVMVARGVGTGHDGQ